MKLRGKIFIDGKIEALTGLNIGGSMTDIVIGGIDNSVIKTPEGVPYIPGSSLKGKMRALSELREGIKENPKKNKKKDTDLCDCGKCDICAIFGVMANHRKDNLGPTRLIVRDAHLNEEIKEQMKNKEGIFSELEFIYTESKWENVIDRKTSQAKHPRQTERVPAGAKFDFNMVFNIFENQDIERFYLLLTAMAMLEDDYIGGSGTRGYGSIKFIDFDVKVKSIEDYKTNNIPLTLGEKVVDLSTLMKDEDIKVKLSQHLGVE
ncbi:MAG: type III-A CRISPR-associated RAMP protein Csm3 [Tissierellia bacterium]|nr:type III-A CRISPR-associated RAMP protein Csm3 [Tissierellia bacterium]